MTTVTVGEGGAPQTSGMDSSGRSRDGSWDGGGSSDSHSMGKAANSCKKPVGIQRNTVQLCVFITDFENVEH